MLRITVEVVPHGNEARAEIVRSVIVGNEGPTSPGAGHDPGGQRYYRWKSKGCTGRLKHHRKDGATALAAAVLSVVKDTEEPWQLIHKGGTPL